MEVDLNGVKTRVTFIKAKPAYPPWSQEDHLDVLLEPEKTIASIISFGITLPLKKYTKEDLQQAIQVEGCRRVLELVKKEAEEQKTLARMNQKAKELADITSELNKLL